MEYMFNNFKIFIENDYEAMSKKAAEIFAAEIKNKQHGNFGFATGGTPVGMYKELVSQFKSNSGLDFSGITSYNLDEYFPISKDNEQSYAYFMHDNLFGHVNIKPENINIPSGQAGSHEAECTRYSAKLKEIGGVDMQLLGIGLNGHIGFNEPSNSFFADTHYVELKQSTIDANTRFFEKPEDVPRHAITIGIREIMMAKKILLVVNGKNKSQIIRESLFGEITPQVPASVLQLHQNVTVILDNEAASLIIDILGFGK